MFDYLAGDRRRLRRGTRAFVREVDLGEVRVFVDHGFQWDGSQNVWLTRARASFALQAGPVFDVRPRTTLARMLGYQGGVSCGDPCFDYFFAVRTPTPETTWRALTTRVRSLLAGEFADARLVSDGRLIALWREGDFGREVDAAAAIEIVHEVARLGLDALDALRRLPGATYVPAHGAWDERTPPSAVVGGPVPVRLGPEVRDGRAAMAATAACGRAAAPYAIDLARDLDCATRGGPDATAIAAAHELGADTLSCDGSRVALRWPELESRREILAAGAELVGRLAVEPGAGVYR